MKSIARQSRFQNKGHSPARTAVVLVLLLLGAPLHGQSPRPHPAPSGPSPAKPSSNPAEPADNELSSRLASAAVARRSGSPGEIAAANELVIASAMRQLAAVRSVEGAYPQAVELFKDSLGYETVPEALLGLAMAETQAGQYPEAIRLARQFQAANPRDLRADRILSSALIQKGDFVLAIEPLTRVAQVDPSIETQYALANCLLQTKRPQDKARAQAVFEDIERQHPQSGSLHVLMGRAYRDAGDLPAAVHEFERAIAVDPRTPHAHYFLGLAKLSLNEWKPTPEAEAEIRKEVEFFPHDYLANYMTGFLLSGDRQYDAAEPYLRAAAAIDPTAPDPFLYLGLNAYAKGDNKTAEEMLRKAVDLTRGDESRSNYQIRRAYVDLGRILANSGRAQESETFLAKARDLQNKTMEQSQQDIARIAGGNANAAAVVALTNGSKVQQTATRSEDDAAELDLNSLGGPSNLTASQRTELAAREKQLRSVLALAYNDLGTSEAVQGHFPDAVGLYRRAEDWDSTLPGLEKNLGQSEFRAGDYQGAISPLTQALLAEPGSHALRGMLGMAYFDLHRFAEAAHAFEPLGPAGMQDPQVGYAWAASLARTGDLPRATQVLTAYAAQPQSPEGQLLIAQLWSALGDYPRAVATLQQALAANPSLPRAHLDMGLAYIHSEHWPEAAKEFQAELALSPGDPDAQYNLGFVYMQQAKPKEAEEIFRQVLATHPGYANAAYQVGKLELERGQVSEAITHLEAAERSSPRTDYIHYQLQAAYRKASRPEDAEKELAIYKQLKASAREQAADRVSVH